VQTDILNIKAVLESGYSVELPATGYSMFPTLRPGDMVIINPVRPGDLPETGNIVVFNTNSELVIHRLIETAEDNNGERIFITRGDCMKEKDIPLQISQIIGVAAKYKRSGNDHSIRAYIPGRYRYLYNRKLLWMYNKLKRAGLFSI
jgi:signal peptidase I